MSYTDCEDRIIRSRIDFTYYDPTYITNTLQNNVNHYNEIPYIDKYKCFNTQLTEELIVKDIHILYFAAERPVQLLLFTDNTITLETSEFYLYQPESTFSFTISGPLNNSEDSCSIYLHCFYATINNPNITSKRSTSLYNPADGTTI